MWRLANVMAATVLLLATAALLTAAEDQGKDRDKQEILKLVSMYQSAFNGSDPKAIAALYTPTGDHIGPQGDRIEGRAELEKLFAAFRSTNKQAKLSIAVSSIRLVGDEMAIVDAIPTMTPPLQPVPAEYHATLVLVKREGRWLIESSRDMLSSLPSSISRLKQLDWLIGTWTGEAPTQGAPAMKSTCDWAANKSFIIRSTSTPALIGGTGSGTEIIGWDPHEQRFRSWDFDSEGAFGQSTWTHDGDRWIIQRTGVFPDGSLASATFILTRIDANTLGVQSRDRMLDGEKQPDIPEFKVKREAPKPGGGVLPSIPKETPAKG
jgi:uncharacterized protein (TIGR02246 family)